MAKKKAETKSDFLRKVLSRNPNLDYHQVSRRWAKAGHPGEISSALYYQVRAKLGIKTEWVWVREPRSPKETGEVYQLKITLKDAHPPIWRRVQVGDCTLDQLNGFIQGAMGWTNSHLHHFRINERLYGAPRLMGENFKEMNYASSTMTFLSEILPKDDVGFRFEYEYDFGDGWLHEVLFEGRRPTEPRRRYPFCLEGARACPPEDVGGVWGYADFLETINDPESEESDELRRWAGGKFDPEAFNAEAATRRMRQGLPG